MGGLAPTSPISRPNPRCARRLGTPSGASLLLFSDRDLRLRLRHLSWPEGPNACGRGARRATSTASGATGTVTRQGGDLPVALRVPSGGRIRCAPPLTTSGASLARGERGLAVGRRIAKPSWIGVSIGLRPLPELSPPHRQAVAISLPVVGCRSVQPGRDHPPRCGPSGHRCPHLDPAPTPVGGLCRPGGDNLVQLTPLARGANTPQMPLLPFSKSSEYPQ
jgi:hypothetical protein